MSIVTNPLWYTSVKDPGRAYNNLWWGMMICLRGYGGHIWLACRFGTCYRTESMR